MNGPADTAEVRRTNLALVLQELYAQAPCSRTDLRAATGLVSGTVSSIVDELVVRGLVVETGETSLTGRRGRPRRLLHLNPSRVSVVTVQLAAEEVIGEIRDLSGQLRWQQRRAHRIRIGRPEDVIETLAEMVNTARDVVDGLPDAWLAATVVAVPAPVVSGRAIGAAIELGLGHTELAGPLRELLSHPGDPIIMNDGRLGALAEYSSRNPARRPTAMAYINGDNGVGGGVVIEGEVYLGSHLMAGECGHICVDMNGPTCGCGARGCLTLYLGLRGIAQAAGLTGFAADHGRDATVDELIRRLDAGQPQAHDALATAGRALAAAIGTMSNYTDLDLVVLGGFLPRFDPWLRPAVEELIATRARHIPEFNPRIEVAQHGEDATRIGAWKLGRQMVLRNPDLVPLAEAGTALPASAG